MNDERQQDLVARALAVARVRALRLGLFALHKTLIDAERRRYEKEHGRIESPHAALRLVLDGPQFQWIHPLSELIVQMDEKLAEEGAIDVAESEAFVGRIRNLLYGDHGRDHFRQEYQRTLQDAPEVVLAHAEVARHL